MLLKEIYEKQHYAFVEEPIDDWRDAIRACCKPLEADGTVEPIYAEGDRRLRGEARPLHRPHPGRGDAALHRERDRL